MHKINAGLVSQYKNFSDIFFFIDLAHKMPITKKKKPNIKSCQIPKTFGTSTLFVTF